MAGYVLNSLGPTIFQAKKAVDQFGKEIEQQNKNTEKQNLLDKIKILYSVRYLQLKIIKMTRRRLLNMKIIVKHSEQGKKHI